MKKYVKGMISGLCIGVMISLMTAYASTGGVSKWVDYNNIKLSINGKEVVPKDANGNVVEPFTIDGTTYLPVRAVANALDLLVEWDGETNTVILNEKREDEKNQTEITNDALYEKNGIKIVYSGFEKDEYKVEFKFCIENNSNKKIAVLADNETINDIMIDGIMYAEVLPGKKSNNKVTFYNSTLDENEIGKINNFQFNFHIIDDETMDVIDDSEMITLIP